ncbi:MAG: YncE family protein, partial [Bacteroidaceae bacterium]|nr:YncE family protein [Bacteroidaceae bacterium]
AIDPNAQPGAVYRVDTTTLSVTGKCTVGYQPEELVITDGRIYVANSGGYRKPHYDNTLSVVDLATMRQIQKIAVAPNLHRVRCDAYGKLWVSSRGDEATIPSRLLVLDCKEPSSREMVVTDTLDIPCSDMCINGDSLYFYSLAWSDKLERNVIAYGIVNVRTKELVTDNFITDGTEKEIEKPYGVAVNPANGDIYVTDGKNYVSSGTVHCYNRDGVRQWSMRAGDIPAHMVFLNREE